MSAALATWVNLTWELDIIPAAPPCPVWPRRERMVPRVDQNQPVTRGLKTGVEGPSPWALFIQMAPNSDLGPYLQMRSWTQPESPNQLTSTITQNQPPLL